MRLISVILLTTAALTPGIARAAAVYVPNASFESPYVGIGGAQFTAGFAVDSTSDSGAAQYKNNYLDYAARTARMLNAEYHCQAISGVGIYKSWWQYPAGDNASMYEDYYFLETATTNWDFSKWTPQVVVINLGENDKNVGGVTQFQAEGYYRDFALALRGHYPDAHIIFALWDFCLQDCGGNAGRLVVAVGGGYIASRQNVADGKWHHVAAVLANDGSPDVNEIKLYIDGIHDLNVDVVNQPVQTKSVKDVVIGSSTWHFRGEIDEVQIYNVALCEQEILRLSSMTDMFFGQ